MVRTLIIIFIALALPVIADAVLLRDLSVGDSGADVRELQELLNRNAQTQIATTGPGSPGQETDYFGPLTQSAVRRYQNLYRATVLTPIGLSSGTGYVGERTRAHMNNVDEDDAFQSDSATISSNDSADNDSELHIDYVTPTSGSDGTEVTLVGSGFDPDGNDVRASFAFLRDVPANEDGTEITFTVRDPFPDDLKLLPFFTNGDISITYGFYIEDGDKRSNGVTFELLFD